MAHVETGWLQTFTGRKVHPLQMRPEDVALEDIAHALSMMCRYTGHVKEFLSVAQHSVMVSRVVPPECALWGLLHDAAEAYVCDLPRPLKQAMRQHEGGQSWYDRAEEAVMVAVALKFGLPWPQPEPVTRADSLLLATEARDLMSPLHPDWYYCEANGFPVLPDRIESRSPAYAEAEFLERFKEVCHATR